MITTIASLSSQGEQQVVSLLTADLDEMEGNIAIFSEIDVDEDEAYTCTDCGGKIPSEIYYDDINSYPGPFCTCKRWTRNRGIKGNRGGYNVILIKR